MKPVIFCLFILFSLSSSLLNPNQGGETRPSYTRYKNYEINGGKSTDVERYPYVVSMMNDAEDLILGSGAILDKNWIICSAFQVSDSDPVNISVRAGSNHADSGGQHLNVSKIITHEQFNRSYLYNVALIKTASTIKLSKTARTIKLAKSTPKAGMKSKVIGYGMDMSGPEATSGRLKLAKTKVSSQNICTTQYGSLGDTCFCADSGESAPCYNDLGDPLVRNRQLTGLYIGGDICNMYNQTEIYANIAALRHWILTKIKENSDKDEIKLPGHSKLYKAYKLITVNNKEGKRDDNDSYDDDDDDRSDSRDSDEDDDDCDNYDDDDDDDDEDISDEDINIDMDVNLLPGVKFDADINVDVKGYYQDDNDSEDDSSDED